MRNKTFLWVIVVMVFPLLLGACSEQQPAELQAEKQAEQQVEQQVEEQVVSDHHNSQNALDWAGTYRGTLPCADCAGIVTIVHLKQNGEYDLYTHYLKDDHQGMTLQSGRFTWDDAGRYVTLQHEVSQGEASYRFQVGENVLFMLDQEGKRIDGNLAEHYRLTMVPDAPLTERYWKVFLMAGQPVGETMRDVHIVLKHDGKEGADLRVSGSGGCNRLMGSYETQGENGLRFASVAMTRMACPSGMDVEQDFVAMLDKVQSFAISGDMLVLYGAEQNGVAAELARLEAVYLY